MKNDELQNKKNKKPNMINLLRPYIRPIGGLMALAIASNVLGLMLPKIMSRSIDAYVGHTFVVNTLLIEYGGVSIAIIILMLAQNYLQVRASERVARDLRERLSDKISRQNYTFVEKITAAKLLTNLTVDVDSIKTFIALAVVSITSSVIIIVGAGILFFMINWRLASAVLVIIPIIGILFYLVFGKVKVLILKAREVIDWLNKVINESILGAALIRVLNSRESEYRKFLVANTEAKNISMQVLKIFAAMVPLIGLIANLAILVILAPRLCPQTVTFTSSGFFLTRRPVWILLITTP